MGKSLSLNYSRYPEGEDFSLLKSKKIVPYQISSGSYDDNYAQRYKAGAVVYYRGEG